MARHESQAKRLSDLVEEFRLTLIQELRSEIEGNASSYFLRKEPFVRDGRRYKDERVAYLEGLERDVAELHKRLGDAKGGATVDAVGKFVHRLNQAAVRSGERIAVAKEFLVWLTSSALAPR